MGRAPSEETFHESNQLAIVRRQIAIEIGARYPTLANQLLAIQQESDLARGQTTTSLEQINEAEALDVDVAVARIRDGDLRAREIERRESSRPHGQTDWISQEDFTRDVERIRTGYRNLDNETAEAEAARALGAVESARAVSEDFWMQFELLRDSRMEAQNVDDRERQEWQRQHGEALRRLEEIVEALSPQ